MKKEEIFFSIAGVCNRETATTTTTTMNEIITGVCNRGTTEKDEYYDDDPEK